MKQQSQKNAKQITANAAIYKATHRFVNEAALARELAESCRWIGIPMCGTLTENEQLLLKSVLKTWMETSELFHKALYLSIKRAAKKFNQFQELAEDLACDTYIHFLENRMKTWSVTEGSILFNYVTFSLRDAWKKHTSFNDNHHLPLMLTDEMIDDDNFSLNCDFASFIQMPKETEVDNLDQQIENKLYSVWSEFPLALATHFRVKSQKYQIAYRWAKTQAPYNELARSLGTSEATVKNTLCDFKRWILESVTTPLIKEFEDQGLAMKVVSKWLSSETDRMLSNNSVNMYETITQPLCPKTLPQSAPQSFHKTSDIRRKVGIDGSGRPNPKVFAKS